MKKYFLIIFFTVAFLLGRPYSVFASTIYSNNFTSDYSGWSSIFGSCLTSPAGLTCNNPGTGSLYQSTFPNVGCISADFTNPSFSDSNTYVGLTDNISSWFHDGMILAASSFTTPGHIGLYDGSWHDTGIPTFTGTHNLKFCYDGINSTGYLDGALIGTYASSHPTRIGFFISLSATSVTHLVVTDDVPSSPTPTPTPIQLPVPNLKQNAGGWQNLTYDLASIWSPLHQTIGTWGCALTSAAMVLNYYHINTLPNSTTPLNPGYLDAWLGVQPDGYVPNGNVNWIALQRLSREAKANNPNFIYDALQYDRKNFTDTTTLLTDLTNGVPDILEEPGHFVVATGKDNNNIFTINDPFYANRTTLASYGNTFSSLGRFLPSFTDLSYILFTADPSLTLTLKDKNGNPVGASFLQQPLQGDGTAIVAGSPMNELYDQEPSTDSYTLTISGASNQIYTVKGFLYDVNGNVKPFTLTGVTDANNQNTLALGFDSQNLNNDTSTKITTINSFLSDLLDLYALKLIKTGAYESLKALGENVQKQMQKHNTFVVKIDLQVLALLLKVEKGNLITDSAYQILSADVQYLQSH